jgi:hypothetical protein
VEVEVRKIEVARVDVAEFKPVDPYNFGENGTAYLGVKGKPGWEGFFFLVCTPRWLTDRFDNPSSEESARFWTDDEFSDERGPLMYYLPSPQPTTMFGTGLFLMPSWSADHLTRSIEAVCRRETGSTWESAASRISRLMPWESDYVWDRQHL